MYNLVKFNMNIFRIILCALMLFLSSDASVKSSTITPISIRGTFTNTDENPNMDKIQSTTKNIVVVGGGNFGTAIANRLANNLNENEQLQAVYNKNVTLWVYEEVFNGRNLSEIINETHENIKYLPGIPLSPSISVNTNIKEVISNADIIFIVTPHQFIEKVLNTFPPLKSDAIVVSLIKGIKITPNGPLLISDIIRNILHTSNIAVVMGANLASEVAHNHIVESTVASNIPYIATEIASLLYCSRSFHTRPCNDMITVELCGALKNIVAMAAGFCDGMGLGHSSKALILRQGLYEMKLFCQLIHSHRTSFAQQKLNDSGSDSDSGVSQLSFNQGSEFHLETLLESCGFPDLVASSYGGRNRLCAMEFIQRRLHSLHPTTTTATTTTATTAPLSQEVTISTTGHTSPSFMDVSPHTSARSRTSSSSTYDLTGVLSPNIPMPEQAITTATIDDVDIHVVPSNTTTNMNTREYTKSTTLTTEIVTSSNDTQVKQHYLAIWKDIEKELLHGQCMQGLDTCIEVIEFLTHYATADDDESEADQEKDNNTISADDAQKLDTSHLYNPTNCDIKVNHDELPMSHSKDISTYSTITNNEMVNGTSVTPDSPNHEELEYNVFFATISDIGVDTNTNAMNINTNETSDISTLHTHNDISVNQEKYHDDDHILSTETQVEDVKEWKEWKEHEEHVDEMIMNKNDDTMPLDINILSSNDDHKEDIKIEGKHIVDIDDHTIYKDPLLHHDLLNTNTSHVGDSNNNNINEGNSNNDIIGRYSSDKNNADNSSNTDSSAKHINRDSSDENNNMNSNHNHIDNSSSDSDSDSQSDTDISSNQSSSSHSHIGGMWMDLEEELSESNEDDSITHKQQTIQKKKRYLFDKLLLKKRRRQQQQKQLHKKKDKEVTLVEVIHQDKKKIMMKVKENNDTKKKDSIKSKSKSQVLHQLLQKWKQSHKKPNISKLSDDDDDITYVNSTTTTTTATSSPIATTTATMTISPSHMNKKSLSNINNKEREKGKEKDTKKKSMKNAIELFQDFMNKTLVKKSTTHSTSTTNTNTNTKKNTSLFRHNTTTNNTTTTIKSKLKSHLKQKIKKWIQKQRKQLYIHKNKNGQVSMTFRDSQNQEFINDPPKKIKESPEMTNSIQSVNLINVILDNGTSSTNITESNDNTVNTIIMDITSPDITLKNDVSKSMKIQKYSKKELRKMFPLFYKIYDIALLGHDPESLFQWDST